MDIEQELIEKLNKILSNGENICDVGIDLIKEEYDPSALAEYAKRQGLAQRLGYLAEICSQAADATNLDNRKLVGLYGLLQGDFKEWQHLEPSGPEWGKRIDEKNQTDINKKWKIYSPLKLEEIEDWIDLYVTKDFLRYNPEQRHEMAKRGVKYTRLRNAGEKALY